MRQSPWSRPINLLSVRAIHSLSVVLTSTKHHSQFYLEVLERTIVDISLTQRDPRYHGVQVARGEADTDVQARARACMDFSHTRAHTFSLSPSRVRSLTHSHAWMRARTGDAITYRSSGAKVSHRHTEVAV